MTPVLRTQGCRGPCVHSIPNCRAFALIRPGTFSRPSFIAAFVAGMPNDDDPIWIHDDRLAKAKFLDRLRHGIDGVIVETGVVGEWVDLG